MSDFKEWAMARKTQGPNGEAASGIQTSAGNPRPPAAQASGPTPFRVGHAAESAISHGKRTNC